MLDGWTAALAVFVDRQRFEFLAWRPLLVLLSAAAVACVSGACGGASGFRRPRLRWRLLFLVAFACSAAAAELMWQLAILLTYVRAFHSFLLQMISHVFNLFLITDC